MADGRSFNSFESLGSSSSCLDGVPFRIGSKFLPPEKIHVSPQLLEHSSCELLEEKYSFETEEGVLAWIRAKEETRRQQKLEAEERRARDIETLTQNSQMKDNLSVDSDNGKENIYVNISQLSANTSQPNFDSILTPTPIYSNIVQKPAENKPNTPIDLTLFEKETDAFENLDLQTINDMEELKNVFQHSRAFNVSSISDAQHQKTTSVSTSEKITSLSLQSKQSVSKPRKACPNGFVSNSASSENSKEVEEGDYVSLMVDFKQNYVSFQNNPKDNSQDKTYKASDVPEGSLPPHMVNSALNKQVFSTNQDLPQPSYKPSLNGLNGVNKDKSSFGLHSDLVYSLSNSPPTARSGPSKKHQSVNYENVMEVCLHSAKSKPELSQFPEPDASPRSSPPPLPQRSTPDQSVYENFPINKPLPPVPSPKPKPASCSSQVDISSLNKPVQLSQNESHVYSTLSVKDQQFVCKLGSMGFPRERVSRAVAKFGQDEKEVIEHLCHVDTLVGRGFHPMKTESALFLFRNNLAKAADYMDSFAQFQELGFEPEKIREALIKHNIDRDKALDDLTAT